MTTAVIHGTLSASEHSAQLRKAIIASTIGTAIDWYDFFLYGTAAGLIFGKLFFPNSDPLTATLAAQSKCKLRGTGLGTLQVRVILFGRIETTSGKTRAADRSGAHQRAPRRW
jgi:hypothetical protein